MKKVLLILIFTLLYFTNSFSKDLEPFKSKENFRAVWKCSGNHSKTSLIYVALELNNMNPALAYMSTKSDSIFDINNNRSIAFRDPQNITSLIFFDNFEQRLTKYSINIAKNKTASLQLSVYPGNKSTEKEYKKWLNLKSKDGRTYFKFMTNYSEKLYKLSEKLLPVATYKFNCNLGAK